MVIADSDPVSGREQRGVRPCVVVSDPNIIRSQRALQGEISEVEMKRVDEGIEAFLGLTHRG